MQAPPALFIALFVGGIILIVAVTFIFTMRRVKARTQETQSFAAQHGFRSEGNVNPFRGLTANQSGILMELARGGGSIRNVLRGATAAGEAIVFDYQPGRIDGGQGGGSRIASTVAAFRVADIPDFQMMGRGRFSFGIKDIDFPSHPGFSRRFMLVGSDEPAIRKLFSPAVLAACEALSEKPNWSLQAGSGWLFVTFGSAGVAEMRELVEQSAPLAAAMQ